MGRLPFFLWYLPPIVLGIVGAAFDPKNWGMEVGASYRQLLGLSTWIFAAAFAYIPIYALVRFMMWGLRRAKAR